MANSAGSRGDLWQPIFQLAGEARLCAPPGTRVRVWNFTVESRDVYFFGFCKTQMAKLDCELGISLDILYLWKISNMFIETGDFSPRLWVD